MERVPAPGPVATTERRLRLTLAGVVELDVTGGRRDAARVARALGATPVRGGGDPDGPPRLAAAVIDGRAPSSPAALRASAYRAALHQGHVPIHAAVVAVRDRLVALAGDPGAGKTALQLALVEEGAVPIAAEWSLLGPGGLLPLRHRVRVRPGHLRDRPEVAERLPAAARWWLHAVGAAARVAAPAPSVGTEARGTARGVEGPPAGRATGVAAILAPRVEAARRRVGTLARRLAVDVPVGTLRAGRPWPVLPQPLAVVALVEPGGVGLHAREVPVVEAAGRLASRLARELHPGASLSTDALRATLHAALVERLGATRCVVLAVDDPGGVDGADLRELLG
jgi:hypothetical protein